MKSAFSTPVPLAVTCVLAFAGFASAGCSNAAESDDTAAQADVVKTYAANVATSYAEAISVAKDLQTAVHAFVDSPSEETLNDARTAWLASRDPYSLTEAYRFAQGPIDNDDADDDIPDGPEGLINAWPLDESYIDYTVDANGVRHDTGIINRPDDFPTINADVLTTANANPDLGRASETSISTGYHAVEFLLWGQDLSADGPGARPYTDYVTGDEATAENADRRGAYLSTVTDLLVDNLSTVNDAWLDGKKNYRASFVTMTPSKALGKIILGMGSMAGGELGKQRMQVAYDLQDQEDEHSCFSDNTLADLYNNALSVQDVLLGSYGKTDGAGIDDLIEAKDPAIAFELRNDIQEAVDNIHAVSGPFDQAILGDDDTGSRQHLHAAISALDNFKEALILGANAIGVKVSFEE